MSIHKRETTKGTRYDVKLRDPHGRMYQRSFRTKREAEAWQANELSDRTGGKWVDPRGGLTPFAEWAAEWLISNPAKRPGSIARDEAVIRVHLKPAFGHARSAASQAATYSTSSTPGRPTKPPGPCAATTPSCAPSSTPPWRPN